jgi:hypothetical protein
MSRQSKDREFQMRHKSEDRELRLNCKDHNSHVSLLGILFLRSTLPLISSSFPMLLLFGHRARMTLLYSFLASAAASVAYIFILPDHIIKHKILEVYSKLTLLTKRDASAQAKNATTTAVAAFAMYRMRQRRFAIAVLFLSAALYLGIGMLSKQAVLAWPVAGIVAAAIVLQVADLAMEYRLRRGLYGTNEYEARQLIRFILAHAEEEGISGGLGGLRVDVDEATEHQLESDWGLALS